jgi:Protein of unknown function (DUF664)
VVGKTVTLRHCLDRHRTIVEVECEDLPPDQLANRAVPPDSMSLLGLIRHLAKG